MIPATSIPCNGSSRSVTRARCARASSAMAASPPTRSPQFGMAHSEPTADWSIAVERIAQMLCAPALRKAA